MRSEKPRNYVKKSFNKNLHNFLLEIVIKNNLFPKTCRGTIKIAANETGFLVLFFLNFDRIMKCQPEAEIVYKLKIEYMQDIKNKNM